MGGGLMQLVAYGSQDIYLTGNPQITFFKIVYRRHTNFSMECIQQTISGIATLSDTYTTSATVTISRNGDLLSQVYIRCDQDNTSGINGDYLVEDVEIEIGGQRIDKHYREWNQVWTELTTPESKVQGLKYMSGAFSNTFVTGSETNQQSIMYPLQFWFCRNIGLALPLIALQYHEVKLQFTWGSGAASDGISRSGLAAVTPTVEVWADYVYLDTDERRRFAQVSHEYLIEQLQLQEEGTSRSTIKLNFDHAIKELIWTVPTSTTESNTILTQQMKLELNGHDRFAFQDREYFTLKQPYVHHSAIPGYNIKEIETPQLITTPEHGATYRVVSATTAPTSLTDGDCSVGFKLGSTTTNSTVTSASANYMVLRTGATTAIFDPKVGDHVLVTYVDDDTVATDDTLGGVHTRVLSVLSVFKSENSLVSSKTIQEIQFDSNILTKGGNANADITAETLKDNISFEIIARTQDPKSRCSQLNRDIFVFSFALNPEEHQPSGACNFSRIESAKFLLSSAGTISNIYAVNYNVLRIMSGMGGLAYAI